MNKTLRLGIIGLGHRAVYLMKLYKTHPNWKIVALCDTARPLVDAAAAVLGDPMLNASHHMKKWSGRYLWTHYLSLLIPIYKRTWHVMP